MEVTVPVVQINECLSVVESEAIQKRLVWIAGCGGVCKSNTIPRRGSFELHRQSPFKTRKSISIFIDRLSAIFTMFPSKTTSFRSFARRMCCQRSRFLWRETIVGGVLSCVQSRTWVSCVSSKKTDGFFHIVDERQRPCDDSFPTIKRCGGLGKCELFWMKEETFPPPSSRNGFLTSTRLMLKRQCWQGPSATRQLLLVLKMFSMALSAIHQHFRSVQSRHCEVCCDHRRSTWRTCHPRKPSWSAESDEVRLEYPVDTSCLQGEWPKGPTETKRSGKPKRLRTHSSAENPPWRL